MTSDDDALSVPSDEPLGGGFFMEARLMMVGRLVSLPFVVTHERPGSSVFPAGAGVGLLPPPPPAHAAVLAYPMTQPASAQQKLTRHQFLCHTV